MNTTCFCLRILAVVAGFSLFHNIACAEIHVTREHVASTDYFVFYSDFETNLNDALIAAGAVRNEDTREAFLNDTDGCFDRLPESQRLGWILAVQFYANQISPTGFSDERQYLIRLELAGLLDGKSAAGSGTYLEIASSLRAAAAPAYEACRWRTQDAANRSWIQMALPMLLAHEEAIVKRLENLFLDRWDDRPVPIDVVERVSWSGANSFFPGPNLTHLLISRQVPETEALETIFHEASHGFMLNGDPLTKLLSSAATDRGVSLPQDLWHALLFFTTGHVVHERLGETADKSNRPMIYGIFERGVWTSFQAPLESAWLDYLNGNKEAEDAIAELLQSADRVEIPPQ